MPSRSRSKAPKVLVPVAWMCRFYMLADVAHQVVVLCLNPAFGWSSSLLAWMNDFSVLELLLPNRDPGTTRALLALWAPHLTRVVPAWCSAVQSCHMYRPCCGPWGDCRCRMYVGRSMAAMPVIDRAGSRCGIHVQELELPAPMAAETPTIHGVSACHGCVALHASIACVPPITGGVERLQLGSCPRSVSWPLHCRVTACACTMVTTSSAGESIASPSSSCPASLCACTSRSASSVRSCFTSTSHSTKGSNTWCIDVPDESCLALV